MEGSRNCMFGVLELMLFCLVVVMRLLQYNVVQVVAFFLSFCAVSYCAIC